MYLSIVRASEGKIIGFQRLLLYSQVKKNQSTWNHSFYFNISSHSYFVWPHKWLHVISASNSVFKSPKRLFSYAEVVNVKEQFFVLFMWFLEKVYIFKNFKIAWEQGKHKSEISFIKLLSRVEKGKPTDSG